jgi:signal transduction histidine kinase
VDRDTPRIDFLREITTILLDFSECHAVELRIRRQDQCFRCEATRRPKRSVVVEVARCQQPDGNPLLACGQGGTWVDAFCRMIIEKRLPASSPFVTRAGSFWTGSVTQTLSALPALARGAGDQVARGAGRCATLVIVPLATADETIGLLQLRSPRKDFLREFDVECYEGIAPTIALALVSQFAHASLRERIKELTCLYSLAQLAERPHVPLEEILQGVVELLPAAWQYPASTVARVVFDGHSYTTANFEAGVHKQRVELVVKDRSRGTVEVGYTEEKQELDEGPFLKEERSLIDTVARQIALLVERREAAEDRSRLQDQLRHADRLATIGQLSAGVAHELNEPLGNILAFAQLASKEPGIPEQVARDLDRIVATSLHAREIIKKLMLFARQMPPQKTQVNFNTVIEDGLSFLESRCWRTGVAIEQQLAAELPEIVADPSQLKQVLVNLVVNAVQAMPAGGTLKITTCAADGHLVLTVEDTGVGMDQEVLQQIFAPFFTTKDIHEGTGLGLPVVHGIITAHGGTISVQSTPGHGSRFEMRLPLTGETGNKEHVCDETVH